MNKSKTQRGITLIALIITIIVLLILAVVAINSVKETGIIQYAQNAVEEYEKGQNKENEVIQDYMEYLQKYDPSNKNEDDDDDNNNEEEFEIATYYASGEEMASLMYFEFYEDGTGKYVTPEETFDTRYSCDISETTIQIEGFQDGVVIAQLQYKYTKIGNESIIYSVKDERSRS